MLVVAQSNASRVCAECDSIGTSDDSLGRTQNPSTIRLSKRLRATEAIGLGRYITRARCQTTADHDRTGPITTGLDSDKLLISRGSSGVVIDRDRIGSHS